MDWGISLHPVAIFLLLICGCVVIQNRKRTAIFFSGVSYLKPALHSQLFLSEENPKKTTLRTSLRALFKCKGQQSWEGTSSK